MQSCEFIQSACLDFEDVRANGNQQTNVSVPAGDTDIDTMPQEIDENSCESPNDDKSNRPDDSVASVKEDEKILKDGIADKSESEADGDKRKTKKKNEKKVQRKMADASKKMNRVGKGKGKNHSAGNRASKRIKYPTTERQPRLSRRERRDRLQKVIFVTELSKTIRVFFPGLLEELDITDPRSPVNKKYEQKYIILTRILSSISHIESMNRLTVEMSSSEHTLENIAALCGLEFPETNELPYWTTINRYLSRVSTDEIQGLIHKLIKNILNNKLFVKAMVDGKYWQVMIDGSQVVSSDSELNGNCIFKVHKKGTDDEWIEYCYYVVEAKVWLGAKLCFSIMSEFVENIDEFNKQDCELNAAHRLIQRIRKAFPEYCFCITGDALYANEEFFKLFTEEAKLDWAYIIRYKQGRIPSILKNFESELGDENIRKEKDAFGNILEYGYVEGLKYRKQKMNMVMLKDPKHTYPFYYLTNLDIKKIGVIDLVAKGRKRWSIEVGFDNLKNHGYYLEHLYSKDYVGMKNHYLLIQIGHMISQLFEARTIIKQLGRPIKKLHHDILESLKRDCLSASDVSTWYSDYTEMDVEVIVDHLSV